MIKSILFLAPMLVFAQETITADEILQATDKNLNSKNRVITSKMIVHGRRYSRTIESRNWVMGTDKAFTEYLSPPREAGTKMLKLNNKLWTFSPQTDRVIQISGHMLRQSVMGSDMSYNDIMEDRPLSDLYKATLERSEDIRGQSHWVVLLEGKEKGLPYPKRRAWIHKKYFLPTKEELYAKSGKLLKTSTMDGIKKVQGRWFPFRFMYKDELKHGGKGTEWIIIDVEFDVDIPDFRFSKALLRK